MRSVEDCNVVWTAHNRFAIEEKESVRSFAAVVALAGRKGCSRSSQPYSRRVISCTHSGPAGGWICGHLEAGAKPVPGAGTRSIGGRARTRRAAMRYSERTDGEAPAA
jgi:hypothetical protein